MIISRKKPQLQLGNTPKVKAIKLSNGKQGNLQTVRVMRTLARARAGHPLIRQLAINILNDNATISHNFIDESKVIGQFVQENVAYVRDASNIEQIHDPLTIIEQIQRGVARADCDDMALLIASLLLSIGHNPSYRMVRYDNSFGSAFRHIYVVDYDRNGRGEKKRIVLDAIIKNQPMGYEVPHIYGEEVEI